MTYEMHEQRHRNTFNRRCIDGSITGCCNCVGYCEFAGHQGYLTRELRTSHNCIKKGCHYYRQKEKPVTNKHSLANHESSVLNIVKAETNCFEGLKVLRANQESDSSWTVYYVAIAEYALENIVEKVEAQIGKQIRMYLLPYEFDTAAAIIFSA